MDSVLAPIEITRLMIAALCNQRTYDTENAFFQADELLEHHLNTREAFLQEFVGSTSDKQESTP